MKNIVYLNGSYMPEDEAKVSIFDRGFLFADGIYEVVPVVSGKVLDKEPFLDRLEYSLEQIQLKWPISKDEFVSMIETLIEKNNIVEGGVYMQVTRGVAPRDFAFPKDIEPTLMAFAFKKEIINNPHLETGVKAITLPDIRWKRRDIKSLSLLAQCMGKEQVRNAGAFEGWMVEDGFVTEGTSSSAYIVKNGTVITRPLSNSILPGIRRKLILEAIKVHNIPLEERPFTVEEALEADEAFMSSATTMVLPIVEIDGKKIGDGKPGELFKKIREYYVADTLKKAE